MDNIPKSTQKEPLKFFQWMFLENGFHSYRSNFFTQFDGYDIIKKDEDEVSYYNNVYNENTGETLYGVVYRRSFSKELEVKLNKEYNNSVKLIKSAIADITYRGNNLSPYLDLLLTHIQELLTLTKTISEKCLFVRGVLQNLLTYIKKEQQAVEQISNEFNTEEIHLTQNIEIDSKNKFIYELFEFLKEEYIPTVEWEYLISYLKSFIIEYKVPYVETLISLPKTNRAMVKWLFYAFYDKLPDNRGIQDRVSELYLRLFETLTPTEKDIKSISKKLSTKPQKLPDDFPSIKGLK